MVTVVQFRAEVTCLRMMKKFVLTSAKHLKEISEMANLDVTLTEAFKLPSERGSTFIFWCSNYVPLNIPQKSIIYKTFIVFT